MIKSHQNIVAKLSQLGITNLICHAQLNELCINVPTENLLKILSFIRDDKDLLFKQLVDICAVDYLGRIPRYDVVYHLLSLHYNQRIRIKISVDHEEAIPTATHLFNAANWYEREIFDLFGLTFSDHPSLHRILTDYNFQGHPLRKDFPLTGYVEPIYDVEQRRVVYKPVILPQEFRDFDFLSPWEGMTPAGPATILPGDEKANVNDIAASMDS